MAHHRISSGLVAAVLLALPLQPGCGRTDIGAGAWDELDFLHSTAGTDPYDP